MYTNPTVYTVAAPLILVVSYGTTRLLSNSPAQHGKPRQIGGNQINYDTSQLYYGFLMGMGCTILGLIMSFLGLCSRKDITNPQMLQSPYPLRSHGTTITCPIPPFQHICVLRIAACDRAACSKLLEGGMKIYTTVFLLLTTYKHTLVERKCNDEIYRCTKPPSMWGRGLDVTLEWNGKKGKRNEGTETKL